MAGVTIATGVMATATAVTAIITPGATTGGPATAGVAESISAGIIIAIMDGTAGTATTAGAADMAGMASATADTWTVMVDITADTGVDTDWPLAKCLKAGHGFSVAGIFVYPGQFHSYPDGNGGTPPLQFRFYIRRIKAAMAVPNPATQGTCS